jgi:hypothetical protein
MRVLLKVKVGSGGSSCMGKAIPPIGLGTDPAPEDFNSPRYNWPTEVRSTLS